MADLSDALLHCLRLTQLEEAKTAYHDFGPADPKYRSTTWAAGWFDTLNWAIAACGDGRTQLSGG
jgi:hypothetical protein